ncbi:MFS transporter [Desulfosporosinus sp. SYSU MS00001]|uniref:MFS transporter n=1 Tax=Desulfosporosinus sp. SYSU MS00001 TaxID=3416284 RepID=UPI003CEBC151
MEIKPTKIRWVLGVFLFVLGFVAYMDRVNLSVAGPMIMQEFHFDKVQFGMMQTLFFIGYAVMQIPGGMVAEYFGARKAMTLAISWWSAFTFFTAASSNFLTFGIVRALFGIGEGPLYPGGSVLVRNWFNPKERGTANSFILAGSFVGPVLAPAITVAVITTFGWKAIFYIFGGIGVLVALGWWLVARDYPKDHPLVNQSELAIIMEGKNNLETTKKEMAPWRNFIGSVQFWAIGIEYFVADYIMYVYLSWLPIYLMEAQKFSLKQMGIAAAFPWLALAITTLSSGFFSDRLIAKGVSVNRVRTAFGAIGLVVSSIALYLAAGSTNPIITVVWLTISLGSLGFTFSSSWASCNELGQKFTGSISGWMNLCGNIGGVVAPTLTAIIALRYGWQWAISATAFIGVIGVCAWFLVRPDQPLVITSQHKENKAA